MGSLEPIDGLILALAAVLLLVGYAQIRGVFRRPTGQGARRRFFEGMNPTTSLALAGAMLLALALLVDVYWEPGSLGENLSLGLAGSGGILTLLSFFLERRSRNRG